MHLSSPHCIINKFILSIYYVMIHSKMDRMDHYILFQRVHNCIAHEHGHELNILILHEYATCSGWLTNRSKESSSQSWTRRIRLSRRPTIREIAHMSTINPPRRYVAHLLLLSRLSPSAPQSTAAPLWRRWRRRRRRRHDGRRGPPLRRHRCRSLRPARQSRTVHPHGN